MTAKEISRALIEDHRAYGWRAEREALFSPRRIDVLAIAPNGSQVTAYEIKVSRQDFFSEIRNPSKRRCVMRHCSHFYFVTPIDLIDPSEVPDDCGLIHYLGTGLFTVVKLLDGDESPLTAIELTRISDEEEKRLSEEFELRMQEEYADDVMDFLPDWILPLPLVDPIETDDYVMPSVFELAATNPPDFAIDFEEVPF